jgi:fumarate reductase flavoprotein subunit
MEIGADIDAVGMNCCVTTAFSLGYWPGSATAASGLTGFAPNAFLNQPHKGLIIVNGSGRRFFQDDASWGYQVREMFREMQRTGQAMKPMSVHVVCDEAGKKFLLQSQPWGPQDEAKAIADGMLMKASTISGLETKMGVPAGNLKDTVRRWNGFCAKRKDLDFGRITDFAPIAKPSYYAASIGLFIMGTGGGLRINVKGEVLNPLGEPIPHLYAAGMVAGGYCSSVYPACGWAILNTIHWGRRAGATAVRNAPLA